MLHIRTDVGFKDYLTYENYVIYNDTSTIAIRKGYDGSQIITVLSNLGADGSSYNLKLTSTGWKSGQSVYDLLTCTSTTVAADDALLVPMALGLPRVYYADGSANGC